MNVLNNIQFMRGLLAVSFATWLLSCTTVKAQLGDDQITAWKYQHERKDNAQFASRSIWLTDQRPDDLVVIKTDGQAQVQFGQFQYGGVDSRTIAIMLIKHDGGSELYMDINRDRAIQSAERVTPGDKDDAWVVNLPAEFAGETDQQWIAKKRHVNFRASQVGNLISYQTIGCLVGQLPLGEQVENSEQEIAIEVYDADGNGRFGDAEDLVLYDANADGKFNRFTEKTTFSRGFTINSERFQLLGNQLGTHISARQRSGFGKVHFEFEFPGEILSARMLLVSRDGITVPIELKGVDATTAEVPSGEYRISSLYMSLKNKEDGQQWNYNFSGFRTEDRAIWTEVKANEEVKLTPLGELQFRLYVEGDDIARKAGEMMKIRPQLTTSSGLLINNCWQGDVDQAWMENGAGATMRLVGSPNDPIVVTASGFR